MTESDDRTIVTLRAAAAGVEAGIRGAKTGHLGATQGTGGRDGYRSIYVHFQSPQGEQLALWIYFAERGHAYSVPGQDAGYWLGLKHDSDHELDRGRTEALSPDFRWEEHIDDRWSGFRRFLGPLSQAETDQARGSEIAELALEVLRRRGFA